MLSVVAIVISFYPLLPLYCTLKELAIACPQGLKLEPLTELELGILSFFQVFPSVFRVGLVCILAYYIILRYGSQRDLAWAKLSAVIPVSVFPLSFLLPFCIHKFPL